MRHRGYVVAINIDSENADRKLAVLQRLDFGAQPLRQRNTAATNSDKGELVEILGFLKDLVSQPHQCAVNLRRAHQLRFFSCGRHSGRAKRTSVTQADQASHMAALTLWQERLQQLLQSFCPVTRSLRD